MGVSFFSFVLESGSFFAIPWKLEQTYPSIVPIGNATTLPELIKIIFNFSLGVSALLLFGVLFWAGILFLISAGDPAKQRRAKERLGSAVLGSILLLTSYLAANIFAPELLILKPAGIPGISLTKTPLFSPQCSDGIDNDGDGKKDFPADPNCQNAADESEFLIECSDGIDNDGDGKLDFPADPQCKELSSISESFEYECVASNDPDSRIELPEITESYPLVSRSKQALATLGTIHALLKDIRDRAVQIADIEAQSSCASNSHDHGADHCHGTETGPCGEALGFCSSGGSSHDECAPQPDICAIDPKTKKETCEPQPDICVCVTDSLGPDIGYHHHYDWFCHRNGGKWNGGGQNEDVGALMPTSTPTLAFINDAINLIDHEADGGAHDIKKTLEALRDSNDPVKNPPYILIVPRDEDKADDGKPFLLSLKRIEDELKNIRDAMNICSRTPNEQVFTFKNIVARGVDAPKPCKDAGSCPEDNDFACLFLPGAK